MVYRVIISHHQSEYLKLFPRDSVTVVVLDDPQMTDILECQDIGYTYITISQSGNRGHNRNAGLLKILETYSLDDCDIVEFFDGDRYPSIEYSTRLMESIMSSRNLDCLLYACGHHDTRLSKIYVPLEGSILVDTGTLCNPFYSCGFAMKVSAIRQVMAFNNGHFFEPRFTKWGCEDQYMGLVCSSLLHRVGMTCEITLNGSVGGDSDTHREYRESLQTYVDLIRERNLPIRNNALF